MPLDPNKLYRKGSATRQAVLFAVEWSAITFAGMLAVLFLGWALALRVPLTAFQGATLQFSGVTLPPIGSGDVLCLALRAFAANIPITDLGG